MDPTTICVRQARSDDARWVAELHADSWRRHYRGSYSDAYLDGDLVGDRLAVWTARLDEAGEGTAVTLVAERNGGRMGFVHARLDHDPVWGALIDNLHVRDDARRSGIGSRLLTEAAACIARARAGSRVHLWVQEQNADARAFYLARGGAVCGSEPIAPPAGDPRNLSGAPSKLRVCWTTASRIT